MREAESRLCGGIAGSPLHEVGVWRSSGPGSRTGLHFGPFVQLPPFHSRHTEPGSWQRGAGLTVLPGTKEVRWEKDYIGCCEKE